MNRNKASSEGFTLIEIIVSVVLISIIVATGVKTFQFLYHSNQSQRIPQMNHFKYQFSLWSRGEIDMKDLESPSKRYTIQTKIDTTLKDLHQFTLLLLEKKTKREIFTLSTWRIMNEQE